MSRTIEDIQKDIELLGIKGGYDIEQLLTPQDCRRLSYEIEKLNNKEERLMRRLEDLIIIGEQVENEWAVDICKMIIEELKGSDKE